MTDQQRGQQRGYQRNYRARKKAETAGKPVVVMSVAEHSTLLDRRRALREECPDAPCSSIPTCGYCGLRWHQETNPDGTIGCDLKHRHLTRSFAGCPLGDAI